MRPGVACLVTLTLLLGSCSTPHLQTNSASPDAVQAQLNYAEFLLSGTPETCETRLELAQQQVGSVGANPRTRVMYPEGWATVTDLEYRIHLARAQCLGATHRDAELRVAVDSARRAVNQYRNLFDYHSMVVMQFDAGVTLHDLGDSAAAITALESAIDMDREYGFADDAAENYKLLLTWRGEPANEARVAELMQDFPQRQVSFQFSWSARDAQVTLESRRSSLLHEQLVTSRADTVFDRRIDATPDGGWAVSYAHRLTQFPTALISEVGYKVSAGGEFDAATESDSFAAELATKTAVETETAPDNLTPGVLEAVTAENYQSETAMWIGAKLDQGAWYEVNASLTLPGLARIATQHRIEFTFTRMVPCSAAATAPACAEIVMRITPDKEALDRLLADYNNRTNSVHINDYSARTTTRIVTDPKTLLPFAHEKQVVWSASLTNGESVLKSEHLLSTVHYSGWSE